MSISTVRVGVKTVKDLENSVQIQIQINKVIKGPLDLPEYTSQRLHTENILVPDDLADNELPILNQSQLGTTEKDIDSDPSLKERGDFADWYGEDGLLKKEFRGKQPELDFKDLRKIIGEEKLSLAKNLGDNLNQVKARRLLIKEFEDYFGLDVGGSNISDGMDMERPLKFQPYPPPYQIATWRGIDPETNLPTRSEYGNYFDPSAGQVTPSELGINSVGRRLELIDVSETPGLAVEGYGTPGLGDKWTVQGTNPRITDGKELQWYIPSEYKPAEGVIEGTNWRDLPGNEGWVKAYEDGRLVFEERGKPYKEWFLDGEPIGADEAGSVR